MAVFLVLALGAAGVLAGCGSSGPIDNPYTDGHNFALDQGANYWARVPPDRAQSVCASDFKVFVAQSGSSDYRRQWVKGCVAASNGPLSYNTGPTGNGGTTGP
jgi:hypothetical protein